ncbi:MAG: hypothetical protein WA185_15430 [Candidatus Acidiferrales bacterium]
MNAEAVGTVQRTRRKRAAIVVALVWAGIGALAAPHASAQIERPVASRPLTSPLRFEASNHPAGGPVKYSARAASYSLFLSNDEADVVLHGETAPSGEITRGKPIVVQAYASLLRMRFVDSDLPTSIGPLDARKRSCADFTAVAYRGIYPGTDVILRGDQRRIAFQLNLSPGADFEHIVLELAGATGINLDADGNAVVHVGRASLILQKPSILVSPEGASQRLPGAYQIETGNRLRFIVAAPAPRNGQTITD